MTALVLQARLDSSRLPRKALLPLGGEALLFRVMEALREGPWELRVLACPDEGDCLAAFGPLAERAGYELVPGPKEDVLGRYCLVIRRFGLERLVRATGDNPFVFAGAAGAIHREAAALGADYGGYAGIPWGAGVEALSAEALLRAEQEARAEDEREHVCPYLYRHPEYFRLHRPLAPKPWQGGHIRLTVDTPEDYGRAQALHAALSGEAAREQNQGETIIRVYRRLFPGAGP